MNVLPFWECVSADILAHVPMEARDAPMGRKISRTIGIVLLSSGFHLSLLYRAAYQARFRGGLPGRVLADAIYRVTRHAYGSSISPKARIQGGLIFPHPQNIVIGADVEIGERVWIFQNVTLGGGGRKPGMPWVGKDCRLLTGAVIAGPVQIGEGAIIGANVVVTRDVPAEAVLVSPPPIVRMAETVSENRQAAAAAYGAGRP